jgi:SPP1 gp7 family putative phage head morphogenesis protein
VFDSALATALLIAAETRRRLLGAFRSSGFDWLKYFSQVRPILAQSDRLFAHVLRDVQLYGYATAGAEILTPLIPAAAVPPPAGPPTSDILSGPFDEEPHGYRLVGLNAAADYLRSLNAVSSGEWQQLDQDARQVSFSIAQASTREAAAEVQQVLTRSVEEGLTFREARPLLKKALDTSAVGDGQIENVYRTYYGKAQGAGQLRVLENPMVRDEFPYLKYSATHDTRVRPEHLLLEKMGLDGGPIYRTDDPFWLTHYPPWAWRCRCNAIPLSLEAAARLGVSEAREWLRTGNPPAVPQFVNPADFPQPPEGWVPVSHGLAA